MGLIRSHISWLDFPMKINEQMRSDALWKTGKHHLELENAAYLIAWKGDGCLSSLSGLINGWHRQGQSHHLRGRHGGFSSTNVTLLYLLQRNWEAGDKMHGVRMTQLAHSDGTRNEGGRKSERITVWSMKSSRIITVSWAQRRNKNPRNLVENVVKRLFFELSFRI